MWCDPEKEIKKKKNAARSTIFWNLKKNISPKRLVVFSLNLTEIYSIFLHLTLSKRLIWETNSFWVMNFFSFTCYSYGKSEKKNFLKNGSNDFL